ncbi:MAG: hypothetical protein Q9188_006825 [Gyalolechia gomerana]
MLDGTSPWRLHFAQNAILILTSVFFLPITSVIILSSYALGLFFAQDVPRKRKRIRSSPTFEPQTILVTGVGMTKGLALARLFYEAGHDVIGADFEPYGVRACGRYSKSVQRFYRLPKPTIDGGPALYINTLLRVVRREKVDLWVSCSGVASAVEDGQAKEVIERRSSCRAIQFDVATTSMLHEKDTFIQETERLGLHVPETHNVTSRDAIHKVLHGTKKKQYIMKSVGMDDAVRGNMTLLPRRTLSQTYDHVSRIPISDQKPWVLQQFIEGKEYCTHSLVIEGQVKAFVACPSQELLMHYEALPADSALNRAMLAFTREFVERSGRNMTGHLSFDLLVDENASEKGAELVLNPIECNPRAHTAVALFQGQGQEMAKAYLSLLRSDLANGNGYALDMGPEEISTPGQPQHAPYPPKTAGLGGTPTVHTDIPITTVFLFLFICGAAAHMTIFQLNKKRGHKFVLSGMMFGFCMARVTTCVMRIVWATRPRHIPVAIAAQVFVAAGVVLLFVINLIFAQRIIRAAHPHGGWHPSFSYFFKAIYVLIVISLIMLITANIQNFYTLNSNTKRIDRDIILYGGTFYAVISFLPFPLVVGGLIIPRKTRVEKFGSGRFRSKIIILLSAAFFLCLGASFRVGTNYKPPRPLNDPPDYYNKACFYIFNFTVEYIVIILYLVVRVDLRFHIPNGSKRAGDYSGINALRTKEEVTMTNPSLRVMSEEEVFDDASGTLGDKSGSPGDASWTPATGSSHEMEVSGHAGLQRGQLFGISIGGRESRRALRPPIASLLKHRLFLSLKDPFQLVASSYPESRIIYPSIDMRLPENLLQKTKIALHGVQGLVIFLAWAITIAIFTKPGSTDGRTKFFFALCWFCIPLLIYQTGIPQFNRTRRFSNAYAHAAIDVLLAIFWFAAFISVATWTREGIKNGVGRPGVKGCDAFAWGGGGSKCHLSQATIGMGVIIFLLFLATSFISIKNLLYYRRNGSLPGITPSHEAHPVPNQDEDDQVKYAFSSNPHDQFDEDEEAGGGGGRQHEDSSTYEVLHPSSTTAAHDDPWRQQHNNPTTSNLGGGRYDDPDAIDTSYHGTSTAGISNLPPQLPPHRDPFRDRSPSPYRVHNPPAEMDDTGYSGVGGRYGNSGGGEAGDPFRDDLALSHEFGGYGGGAGRPGGSASGRVDFPEGDYHRT